MTQRSTSPSSRSETPRVRLGGPADAIIALAHVLGFVPARSLVFAALRGPRMAMGPVVRYDDDLPPHIIADQLRQILARYPADGCLLIHFSDSHGFGDGPAGTSQAEPSTATLDPLPTALLDHLAAEMRDADVGIRDLLVVRSGRWFSLLCDSPDCCPPEGTPLRGEVPSAAELEFAMHMAAPAPSRDALRNRIKTDPRPGLAEAVSSLVDELGTVDVASRLRQLADATTRLLEREAGGQPTVTLAESALLVALVQHVDVRDAAVLDLGREQLYDAVTAWSRIYAGCPAPYDIEVGAIVASLAWESGQGTLASCVCEAVLAAAPEHRLTQLTASAISYGIMPTERPTTAQARRAARAARSRGRSTRSSATVRTSRRASR